MYSEMAVEEQVQHLKGCLPLRQFEKVTSSYNVYTEETVQELIEEGKKTVRLQMENGRDHWGYLKEEDNVLSDSSLLDKPYRELVYYSVAMGNSLLQTYPIPFDVDPSSRIGSLLENDDHTVEEIKGIFVEQNGADVEKAFSKVGRNIWDVLDKYPEIRLAHFEDRNHIYIEFWVKAKDERQFHERKGEFFEYPVLRKLDCRIHLDDGFIELRGRNDREKDRDEVLHFLENMFNNSIEIRQDELDITDDTIRYFFQLDEFVTLPHASKDGTAQSNWSSDSDVRDDSEFPDHRPHKYGNMVFEIDSIGRVSFQLSAEDDSFRIFMHKITPQKYREVSDYIWRKVHDANN